MRAGPHVFLSLLLLVGASGCVVDGTLDAAGGGTLTMRYRLVSIANLDHMKGRLASPDVTLTQASMTPDKQATFGLAFRNVRALSTAPAFASAQVALADDADGLRTLVVTLPKQPGTLPAPYAAYLGGELRVTLAMPGEIVRSNATSVNGRSATWTRSIDELQQQPAITFSVTFRPAA
jgi:hypothetical protein